MSRKKLEANTISNATKASMKTRIISALVGLAIIVPCIGLGDWVFFGFCAVVTFIGIFEIVRSTNKKQSIWLYIVSIILAFLLVYWPVFRKVVLHDTPVNPYHPYNWFDSLYLSIVVIVIGIMLLFMIVILRDEFKVNDACYLFTFVILISLGIQSLLYIRYIPMNGDTSSNYDFVKNLSSCTLFLYIAIATFSTDIGAYFVGVFFGKHKINERISPKKTVEGFIGGIVISAIISGAFAFIMALTGNPVLVGVYDLTHWYNIVILSLILPFVSTLGDFVYSAIKRTTGIKDFGNCIPGHGGILDRFDSLSFAFISSAIYTCIILGSANGTMFI